MAKISTRLNFSTFKTPFLRSFKVLISLTLLITAQMFSLPIATMGQTTGSETTISVPKLTPAITVSKTTLNFEKVYTGYHSLPQSYTVTGTNLTEAIVVTAPTGIEITKTCGSGYGSSISLTPTAGSVSATIYARYNGGAVSASITHTHTGATTMNVTISEAATSTNLPSTYYNAATGTGAALKTQLYNIIKTHTTVSYDNLWTTYATTDVKPNGKIWDMYSDGDGCLVPAYEFTYSSGQCGSYSNEGDCYNREHSMPKSWFNDASPMYSDLFHIVPTDGKVNGMRSNYPFGEVTSPTYTSTSNGSKLGPNTYGGTYTGTAFEPNDAFKGDFARNYFYMATCYENVIANWESNDVSGDAMLDGLTFPCFEPWALQMLIDWHNSDPVDQKEKSRNDAVYSIQGNRNPFIDHPEYVAAIWVTSPTLSVTPASITGLTYITGNGPSAAQTFSLSGSNLTGFTANITVTAPANFEVSTDGTNFATSKTVSYTSATLANTTIYVRLKTALAVNTYSGNITLTGGGDADGATVSVSGSVTAIIPTLTTSVSTLSGFTYVTGAGPSTEKNFTLSGVNLTGFTSNITVTAPANYEVSLTSGGTFASTASIPYTSATLASTTIYVRLVSGLAVGSYTGNVTITGGGDADGASVALTGNVSTNTSSACLSESFIGFTAGTHAVPGSTDLSASLDTYTQTTGWTGLKIFPAAGEIKLGSSTALGYIITPAVDLSAGGSVTFDIQVYGTDAGLVQVSHAPDGVTFTQVGSDITPHAGYTPQTVAITGGTALSKIKIGTTAKRVYLDNIAVTCGSAAATATLTVDPSTLTLFTYAFGAGPSASQLYTLSGSDLNGFPSTITVTAPVNYEVSLSLASGYGSSVAVAYTEATLTATPIYVRLKAGLAVGNYNSEIITNAGGGATTVNVTCSGSVTPPATLTVSPTTLTGFNYIFGAGPSVAQSYTLSGANLTGFPSDITVSAPANYEICLSVGGTYTSSLNVAYSSATLSATTIFARLKAGLAVGTYNSQIIANAGGGATTVNVTCSGSVTAAPVLTVSPTTLTGFNYIFGAGPSVAQSYTLSGANLTGFPSNIIVTAPANYEICLTVGGTYTSSLNVAYSSATLSATTIYVRLKAGLAVGTYNAQIVANAGGGATTTNVTCSGSVTAAPVLTVSPTTLTGLNYVFGAGPSIPQTFTLSGANLTGFASNIVVTAPTNYEICLTIGGIYTSSLNIPYTTANLSSTIIYVRLKAGLPIGTYNSEIITITGGGATAVNVTCSGSVTSAPTPSLVVNPNTLSGFSYIYGSGPSTAQSYNLSGTNLTGFTSNIVVTAPTNYEISLTAGGTYTSSLNVAYSSATLSSTTIFIRLKAGLTVGDYNAETVANTGGGATTVNVTCSGSVAPPATPIISTQPSTSAQAVCLNGTLTALTVAASPATGYQWYSNPTASNTGGTLIGGASNASFIPPTTVAGTLYYYCVVTNILSTVAAASNISGGITVIAPSDATWTAPSALCQSATSINLNSLLATTSTTGGTWSGTGVTGNMFNPAGLNGNISVTYTVGTAPCVASESHNIQVVSNAVATWTAPSALCQSATSINLNSLLTGTSTTGGTWSGTGVTGNMFNPAGLSGNIAVTYTVGTAPCVASESHNIEVVPNAVASWTAPSALCQSATSINLNSLLTGTSTTGGTWSGTGVTGNMFNPDGLSGNFSVTYTVGTAPCVASESHNIEVVPNAVASWTAPSALCQSATSINLNSLLATTSTTGGTWSGIGVSGNIFNPAGLSGNISVTYTVGTAPCVASESHNIEVIAPTTPSITGSLSVNVGSSVTLTGTPSGGTWSSETTSVATIDANTGLVSGISAGTSLITYIIGCGSSTATVTVNNLPATLNVSPSALIGFSYIYGSGPSAEQTYNLSGSNLDGSNVTITPSVNYEISLTSGTGFSNTPLVLPSFNGTSTPIYVRLKAGLTTGFYNSEVIANTGGGATAANVTCSGDVTDDISITEVTEKLTVAVYPNPFNNNLTVHFSEVGQETTVVMFDVIGKTVIAEQRVNSNKLELNTTSLTPGIYTLKIRSNGSGEVFKIVKK